MKKTLIALAVAASAVVSGSAMAWETNGTGGNVELGGTLTPQAKVTPWEVQVGAPVTNLDGFVQKNQRSVEIPVKKAIPVLGIRTQLKEAFAGKAGISPQIDYQNAVNIDGFRDGSTKLQLNIVDKVAGQKIGTMSVDFFAAAEVSQTTADHANDYKFFPYASQSGDAFFGGVAKNSAGTTTDVSTKVRAIDPAFVANYITQNTQEYFDTFGRTSFSSTGAKYSGYYGSGILSGKKIQLTLDAPAANDAITWKASLPVTVSYQ